MVVARGRGGAGGEERVLGGGIRSDYSMGTGFSFGVMKCFGTRES